MTPANWPATATDLLAARPEVAHVGIAADLIERVVANA